MVLSINIWTADWTISGSRSASSTHHPKMKKDSLIKNVKLKMKNFFLKIKMVMNPKRPLYSSMNNTRRKMIIGMILIIISDKETQTLSKEALGMTKTLVN